MTVGRCLEIDASYRTLAKHGAMRERPILGIWTRRHEFKIPLWFWRKVF